VAAAIRAGRVVAIAKVRSRCDALLFFLSWVFDLNSPAATRQLLDAGWYDRLAAAVAPAGGVRGLVRKARTYAAAHAAGARAGRLPV
jgi:hypothetical protein